METFKVFNKAQKNLLKIKAKINNFKKLFQLKKSIILKSLIKFIIQINLQKVKSINLLKLQSKKSLFNQVVLIKNKTKKL